jgi:alkyl hydroperoxide reductase subunit AhpC
MTSALVSLILSTALPVGTELHYTGTVSQPTANGASIVKNFTITALVVPGEAGAAELLFQVDERGGGGWPWPERFGRFSLAQAEELSIRVLQTFDGNDYPLPVRRPVFEFLDRLQPDAMWTVGQHQYHCLRAVTQRDRECWLVEASLDRARRQRIHVEHSTGLVVTLEERLFLGRGDPFELKLQLESSRNLTPDAATRNTAAATALLSLQQKLARPDSPRQLELSAEQVEATVAALPALKLASADTGWQRLVETIDRDVQQQRRRLEGVNGLAQKFIGQTIALPDLKLLSGETIKSADVAGQVVVLHFWDYPGDKMIEPYGQVGYLDFLNNRRQKLGVKVVGIAVDERLRDAAQRGAAQRSIRKLQEFMNLSYPIAFDDGTLLKQFGDPRSLGSALPLWVVIGGDGKVTHYHVNHYDIKPDEGLKPLDAAVVEALKQRARN